MTPHASRKLRLVMWIASAALLVSLAANVTGFVVTYRDVQRTRDELVERCSYSIKVHKVLAQTRTTQLALIKGALQQNDLTPATRAAFAAALAQVEARSLPPITCR